MEKKFVKFGVVLSSIAILGTTFVPTMVVSANETNHNKNIPALESKHTQSDIKEQFDLTDSYLDSFDRNTIFIPTEEQQKAIDTLLSKKIIGLDDVLTLIAIVGAGYAAGHWAGAQANKRFGLKPATYKANRWWWRAGITAAVGVPAAVGFDDYFYGI